jgi:hypothetical protein
MVDYVVNQEALDAGKSHRQTAPKGILPPYFGREAENRFREVNRQRAFLRGWLHQNWTFAIARREIADRRAAAFAAAGLD